MKPVFLNNYISNDPDGPGSHSIADKTLTATGTVETTFSTTDTGDQMWATVVTFKATVAAAVAAAILTGPLSSNLRW